MTERQAYVFGRFRIDTHSRVLLRDGDLVPVPPKTADLLLALIGREGELVTRDELMKIVWPDTFVEDNNLAKHIFQLRKTLGSNDQGVPYIETVPKRGYRFVGHTERDGPSELPVIDYADHIREHIVIEETEDSVGRWRGMRRPWLAAAVILSVLCVAGGILFQSRASGSRLWRSVLIVPFTVSGQLDANLGAAFGQELAARLRTIENLKVVSPLGSAHIPDISKRSGVETILSGTVAFGDGRLRVTAHLASAHDGNLLWAEEAADLDISNLSEAQVRLASAIAARLSGRLLPGKRASLERRGSTNAAAYDAFLRGRAETLRIDVENSAAKAASYFETAVRLDPGFADAWAGLARAQQLKFGSGDADRSVLTAALANARRALAIDPDNIAARNALVRIFHSTDMGEQMLREGKRAIEINADDPDAQVAAALAYFRNGILDRAVDLYEKYLASYPDDEDATFQVAEVCLFAREYERGIRHAQPLLSLQRLAFPSFLLFANSGDFPRGVALARQLIGSSLFVGPRAYFGAQVLDRAGLHDEAQAAWAEAAERMESRLRRAENERARMFLGMIYSRLNRTESARDQVRRALALNPGDPWALFFASETYALLDDRAAAFEALRNSIKAGFLGLHYLSYYQRAPNGWYRYREDPEFTAIYSGLERKIAELRTLLTADPSSPNTVSL